VTGMSFLLCKLDGENIVVDQDLEIKKSVINSADFSMIVDKMVNHQGWYRRDAEEVSRLYRNYLFLCVKYPQYNLPPSEDVDEFWHNHVLDTKKYRKDCDEIFGKYRDHYPYFGIDGKTTIRDLSDAFDITQKLHMEEFGECIYEIRSPLKKLASSVKLFAREIKERVADLFNIRYEEKYANIINKNM
jgi:hypothetical protein